ncbi:MAG: MauE/DoxX family redox-associated membrane protein [Thermoguttaceae bacterium]
MRLIRKGAEHVSRAGITPFDIVRVVLAVVLFVAATLKVHQLGTTPVRGPSLLNSPRLLIAVVQTEILVGLWLLVGFAPRLCCMSAACLFILFSGLSAYKGFSGEATCGCWGRVDVSPWWTFSLDCSAVVALVATRPRILAPRDKRAQTPATVWIAVAIVWLALGLAAELIAGYWGSLWLGANGREHGREMVALKPQIWEEGDFQNRGVNPAHASTAEVSP